MLSKPPTLHPLLLVLFAITWLAQTNNQILFTTTITIDPYQNVQLSINSPLVPDNSSYIFSVNYTNTTSVNIFQLNLVRKDQNSVLSIWNYQSYTQTFTLSISGATTDTLDFNLLNIGAGVASNLFAAVFEKSASDGFMLPFNMFNQKTEKFFVVSHDSELQLKSYNLQPFLSTYWTEIKQTIIFMPFLPFFSQCTFEKSYIILNDLLLPETCIIDDQLGMQCQDRSLQIDCIIEQLLVSSVDNEYWFNHYESILFYLFPKQLTTQRINYYKSNDDVLSTLVETYYKNLIPVYYRRKSSDVVLVNRYQLKFTLNYADTNEFEIITAEIIGTYDVNIPTPQSKVTVQVIYLQNWQNFNLYNQAFYWYIIYAMFMGCIMGIIIKLIQLKTGNIELGNKLKLIYSPVLKGFVYALLTGGSFIILMHIICEHTNFSSVSALFDGDMTGQLLLMNNKGRNGLILLFTGVYILNKSLQQAFKVSSSEQLKIVFEDDKQLDQNEEQLNEKIEFTKKNMFNHKRSILIGFFLMCFLGLIFFFNLIQFDPLTIALIQLVVFPFMYKFTVQQQKILIFKELLYISGQYICMILAYAYYLLKNKNLYEFTYLYIVKFIISFFLDFGVELFMDNLIVKIAEKHETNCLAGLVYKNLSSLIDNKIKQSEYERSLYYAALIGNKMMGIMLFPFAISLILLTEKNNLLPQTLFITQQSIFFPLLMVIILIPVEIYALFTVVEVLKRYFGIRIEEVIKFCHFKFKRSKFRWMNDEFAHSRDIQAVYREFQKFAFSSQLFFNTCLQALSLFVLGLGVIIIILSGYLLFNDPVVLPMFLSVWLTGDLLSVAVSFIAVKLRLYEKKEEETMRQSLYKIEKYLKLNDTHQYLQLQGVKDYFLNFNREWIIFNFSKIFTKEDLEENNGELITKYKHYKSIFKKKQIEERRRIKKIKESSSSDIGGLFLANDQPIKFNERKFNTLAKPIMYYWFYLSKQNIYLKNIVNLVKKEKIKPACEYCNMDVELQALEKKEFYLLVNSYRLLNVGRIFDETAFLEYYRLNQQYITICLQCKDKNLHLETKINTKGISSKIVLSWLLTARSNLLHKRSA